MSLVDLLGAITDYPFFTTAALAGVVALFGIVRDHYHIRRADLDKVSLVSWGTVSSAALILAIVSFAIGLRTGG